MKSGFRSLVGVCVVLFAWSTNAFAGCTNEQFAGTWDVVFSDGNTCRLIVDADGNVLTNPDRSLSTCYDPFRGETAPDSGTVEVAHDCSAAFDLTVESFPLEMYGRIAKTRDIGAGFYVLAQAIKGSFNMIRAK